MKGPIRCVVIAGLLTGCGDDTTSPGTDAAVGGGLVVAWSSMPVEWPGELGDGTKLERATFAFDRLRVVGDAAPGDPRTTASSFTVEWDAEDEPTALAFPEAPGGVYSQLSLLIDGGVAGPSIELRGITKLAGEDVTFRISDDSPVAFTLGIATTLAPPRVETLGVHIDFAAVIAVLDFATFRVESGGIELSTGDPQMPTFRSKLVESFSIEN
jgi:hypothetical protein